MDENLIKMYCIHCGEKLTYKLDDILYVEYRAKYVAKCLSCKKLSELYDSLDKQNTNEFVTYIALS